MAARLTSFRCCDLKGSRTRILDRTCLNHQPSLAGGTIRSRSLADSAVTARAQGSAVGRRHGVCPVQYFSGSALRIVSGTGSEQSVCFDEVMFESASFALGESGCRCGNGHGDVVACAFKDHLPGSRLQVDADSPAVAAVGLDGECTAASHAMCDARDEALREPGAPGDVTDR